MQSYTFADKNPLPNLNYYRLKQMDFDGHYEYSKIISIQVKKEGEITVFPNPTTGQFTINGIDIQNTEVSIYNTVGQLVKQQILTETEVDMKDLVNGLYYLSVKQGNEIYEVKVLKE